MSRLVLIALSIILFTALHANDGVYMSSGSNIYPVYETDISMHREFLTFKVVDEMAYVSIEFHFLNPGSQAKAIQVGFQAPSAAGDVGYEVSTTSQISDFEVAINDTHLPYQIYAADCEGCELQDTASAQFSQEDAGVFVYLFDATFEPGITRVNHSYAFPASSNVMLAEFYSYILTTGAKWASGAIGEFELTIDMGGNSYFYVSDIFGLQADWSIEGNGKVIEAKPADYEGDSSTRMIRVLDGALKVKAKQFNPKHNIEFGIHNARSFSTWEYDIGKSKLEVREALMFHHLGQVGEDSPGLSKADLRIIRNTIYAQHGYAFKSKDLQAYFREFDWYISDPDLGIDAIDLSQDEADFVKAIKEREAQY